jgi:hypothetical protein
MNHDVIIQIFSPLIASQRIMLCQFDNSYQSITCENDLRIVFEEVRLNEIDQNFEDNFLSCCHFPVFRVPFCAVQQRSSRSHSTFFGRNNFVCEKYMRTRRLHVSTTRIIRFMKQQVNLFFFLNFQP